MGIIQSMTTCALSFSIVWLNIQIAQEETENLAISVVSDLINLLQLTARRNQRPESCKQSPHLSLRRFISEEIGQKMGRTDANYIWTKKLAIVCYRFLHGGSCNRIKPMLQ